VARGATTEARAQQREELLARLRVRPAKPVLAALVVPTTQAEARELQEAELQEAESQEAELQEAESQEAELQEAELQEAGWAGTAARAVELAEAVEREGSRRVPARPIRAARVSR
jgi:uncharacterized protein YjbI with pentapeptide repeats